MIVKCERNTQINQSYLRLYQSDKYISTLWFNSLIISDNYPATLTALFGTADDGAYVWVLWLTHKQIWSLLTTGQAKI